MLRKYITDFLAYCIVTGFSVKSIQSLQVSHYGAEKMKKSMRVNSLCSRTGAAYLRAVRMLIEYYGQSPDHLGEDQLLETPDPRVS